MKRRRHSTHAREVTVRLARVLEAQSTGDSEQMASPLVRVDLQVRLPVAAPRSAAPNPMSTPRGRRP